MRLAGLGMVCEAAQLTEQTDMLEVILSVLCVQWLSEAVLLFDLTDMVPPQLLENFYLAGY